MHIHKEKKPDTKEKKKKTGKNNFSKKASKALRVDAQTELTGKSLASTIRLTLQLKIYNHSHERRRYKSSRKAKTK